MLKFVELSDSERNIVRDLFTHNLLREEFREKILKQSVYHAEVAYTFQRNGFTNAVVKIGEAMFAGSAKRLHSDRPSIRGKCLAFRRAIGIDKDESNMVGSEK